MENGMLTVANKALLFIAILIFSGCLYTPKNISPPSIDVNLKDGDVIFRKGMGLTSKIVLHYDSASSFSHIGVVMIVDKQAYVVHSVPEDENTYELTEKLCVDSINKFFSSANSESGKIYRYPLTKKQRKSLREYLLVKTKDKIVYDHNYSLEDSTRLYCTELVWMCYNHVGIDISEDRRVNINGFGEPIIMPSNIEQNSKLTELFSY